MIDFKKKYEKYKYKYYNLIKLEKNKKMQGGATSESLINVFGVTGSIGLFAIIAAIIYFLFNKKNKKDEDEEEDMIQLKYNIADKETKELTHSANTNIDINNDSYNIEQKELLVDREYAGVVITPMDTHLMSAIVGLYFGGSIVKK